MDLYLFVDDNGVEALRAKDGSNFFRQSNIHGDFNDVKNDPENNIEPHPEPESETPPE